MDQVPVPAPQRAALALGTAKHETALRELAGKHVSIVAITNKDGYQQCHAARMELKNKRLDIERSGKAARDDAQKFAKAVIDEQNRLIGIIQPEESRLQKLQDEWDAAEKAKREAAERAEAERRTTITQRIAAMERLPVQMVGQSVVELAAALEEHRLDHPEDWAQEYLPQAKQAHLTVAEKLAGMHAAALAAEAEARRQAEQRARLEQERAELEQKQAEQRAAEEKSRLEREAVERQHRLKMEEEDRIARARREEEDRQARAAREEADRKAAAERAAEEARIRAERDRVEAERRKLEEDARAEQFRKDEEARAARLEDQRKREAEENAREMARREQYLREAEELEARQLLEKFLERFGQKPEYGVIVVAIRSFFDKQKKAA